MKRNIIITALAMLALAPTMSSADPFLSSSAYLVTSAQPTEFLVSINDQAEIPSAAVNARQSSTITITGYDTATTYKVTIGGVDVTQVGTGGNAAMTAQALTTALNNSVDAGFAAITWSSTGAVITGKADAGGVSFTATTSVTGGAGTIGSPVALVLSTSKSLAFDLVDLPFGSYTASVKAQNNTSTSSEAVLTFDVGIETPNLTLMPKAP